ncbi:MAG: hypothetical protein A4E31_00313 [Methanomassiliicoccales archaeon PtaU1.Bin030]|nr:MAG: hypothetical protein A4E31_00313 [Methanomassiliicoccales archaeon PtaU1.Bin030]
MISPSRTEGKLSMVSTTLILPVTTPGLADTPVTLTVSEPRTTVSSNSTLPLRNLGGRTF